MSGSEIMEVRTHLIQCLAYDRFSIHSMHMVILLVRLRN